MSGLELINYYDFKAIASTSFHPVTPLFINTWRGYSHTKWLGITANLTYKPYYRNGWAVIDTAVKGTTGTPFLEFSC